MALRLAESAIGQSQTLSVIVFTPAFLSLHDKEAHFISQHIGNISSLILALLNIVFADMGSEF